MKELFNMLAREISQPLWEIHSELQAMRYNSEDIKRNIDGITDALYEQNRIHLTNKDEVK